jgi:integrase
VRQRTDLVSAKEREDNHERSRPQERRSRRGGACSLYRDGNLVFATQVGTSLEPSNIDRRSFKPLLKEAGLPDVRYHDRRHT